VLLQGTKRPMSPIKRPAKKTRTNPDRGKFNRAKCIVEDGKEEPDSTYECHEVAGSWDDHVSSSSSTAGRQSSCVI
jgi:hypothetical protein